jgi:hypothetical protein
VLYPLAWQTEYNDYGPLKGPSPSDLNTIQNSLYAWQSFKGQWVQQSNRVTIAIPDDFTAHTVFDLPTNRPIQINSVSFATPGQSDTLGFVLIVDYQVVPWSQFTNFFPLVAAVPIPPIFLSAGFTVAQLGPVLFTNLQLGNIWIATKPGSGGITTINNMNLVAQQDISMQAINVKVGGSAQFVTGMINYQVNL